MTPTLWLALGGTECNLQEKGGVDGRKKGE